MNWPRRQSIPNMTNAELAIRDVIFVVEKVGADVLLTEAVVLLGQAKDKVADYVDKMNPEKATIKVFEVDRTQRTLTDGSEVTDDHRELRADGQQKAYVVLSAAERAKGFVRPVRSMYRHKTCHTTTTMGSSIAETYARDPKFYSGTFCCACAAHFPLDQFVWGGTDEQVGS